MRWPRLGLRSFYSWYWRQSPVHWPLRGGYACFRTVPPRSPAPSSCDLQDHGHGRWGCGGTCRAIPIPTGMQLLHNTARKHLQLVVDESLARRFRRVFGYVAEIQLQAEGRGAINFLCKKSLSTPFSYNFPALVFWCLLLLRRLPTTPGYLQVLLTAPWRYGDSVTEVTDIFIFARCVSFVSRSACASPAVCVRLGGVVSGFIGPTNGGPKLAQLVGWELSSVELRSACSPNTSPTASLGGEWRGHFAIPHLAGGNFAYGRLPRANFAFFWHPVPFPRLSTLPRWRRKTRLRC